MPIETIIADDEPLALRRVRSVVESEGSFTVVDECPDGETALRQILKLRPALVILDVQMPLRNGFEVMRDVALEYDPAVLFVTAFDEYAVAAFETHAVDYVVKPFTHARLLDSLARAKERIASKREGDLAEFVSQVLKQFDTREKTDRLTLKADGRFMLLDPAEIHFVEAEGDYVRIHTPERNYFIRETMHSLESKLAPRGCLRVHRSTIVNPAFVKEIRKLGSGDYEILLRDGSRLAGSRHYRNNLIKLIAEEE